MNTQPTQPTQPKRRRGPLPKYPWSLWTNHEPHTAQEGVDYTCTTGSFVTALHNKAAKIGHYATTRTSKHTISTNQGTPLTITQVTFKFTPKFVSEDDPMYDKYDVNTLPPASTYQTVANNDK